MKTILLGHKTWRLIGVEYCRHEMVVDNFGGNALKGSVTTNAAMAVFI